MALSSTHTHTLAIDSSLQVLWLPHELRSIFAARSEFCLQQELLFPHMNNSNNNSSSKNISSLPAPNAVSFSASASASASSRGSAANATSSQAARGNQVMCSAPRPGPGTGPSIQCPAPSTLPGPVLGLGRALNAHLRRLWTTKRATARLDVLRFCEVFEMRFLTAFELIPIFIRAADAAAASVCVCECVCGWAF